MPLLPSIAVPTKGASSSCAAISCLIRGAAVLSLSGALVVSGCESQTAGPGEEVEALEEAARQKDEEPEPERVQVLDDDRSVAGRLDDARIAAQIRLALVDADELRSFDFDPVVVGGRVLLRGEVRTQAQRERAADVAGGVNGVRGVINQISSTEEPVVVEAAADSALVADTSGRTEEPARAGRPADAAAQQAEESAEQQATHHTVKSGESLWTISRQHGVTIDQIKRLNNLRSNSIRPGQRIRVK